MSSNAIPISPQRFAAALNDLPISSLHAKISELQNSIAHLDKSNKELEEYVRQEDDRDCYEALMENRQVVRRMEERIELVRREITEVRGLPLGAVEAKTDGAVPINGDETPSSGNRAEENGENGTEAAENEDRDIPMIDAGLASEHGARRNTTVANTNGQTGAGVGAQQNGTGGGVQEDDGVFL